MGRPHGQPLLLRGCESRAPSLLQARTNRCRAPNDCDTRQFRQGPRRLPPVAPFRKTAISVMDNSGFVRSTIMIIHGAVNAMCPKPMQPDLANAPPRAVPGRLRREVTTSSASDADPAHGAS